MRRGWSRPGGSCAGPPGRAEAVAPDVGEQVGAEAGAERVAVDADDAGDGAAVGVERRRAVVGLHLVDEVVAAGGGDDAGVVVEDRDQPALPLARLDGGVDGRGGAADVLLEEGADLLGRLARFTVGDGGVEDLVLAVLRPGLGQALQLDVGRVGAEAGPRRGPGRRPPARRSRAASRSSSTLSASSLSRESAGQRGVVEAAQPDRLGRTGRVLDHARHREVGRGGLPLGEGLHGDPLDHLVGEQLGGDARGVGADDAGEQVDARGVDGAAGPELAAEQVLDGDAGRLADRVGDARLEADRDGHVEGAVVDAADRALPDDGAGELGGHAGGVGGGEGRLDVEDVAGADRADRDPEVGADGAGDGEPAAVGEAGAGGDLDAGDGQGDLRKEATLYPIRRGVAAAARLGEGAGGRYAGVGTRTFRVVMSATCPPRR